MNVWWKTGTLLMTEERWRAGIDPGPLSSYPQLRLWV